MANARLAFRLGGADSLCRVLRHVDRIHVRRILTDFGAHVGEADVESGLWIHNAARGFGNLTLQDGCHIGKDVFLDLRGPIVVREGSTVSLRTTVLTHTDLGNAAPDAQSVAVKRAAVEIGPRAFLGACCTVLPGCRIGADAVVGAGAVVTTDVRPGDVVVGVPARRVRNAGSEIRARAE
jgi:acetyltransferase-like isoleucine patch superfamily enzyme